MKNMFKRLLLTGQIAMLTGLVGLSGTAQAVAPANSTLQIGVTVTIGGEALVQEVSPVAGVKVDLAPSPPTVSGTGVFVFEEESATITYTITTTANGFDAYNLTAVVGNTTGVAEPLLGLSRNSVGLGATAVLSVEGNEITVPFDGAEDNFINGIKVGATVVIDGQAFTVGSVTDTAETSMIGLTESLESTPTQGTLIAERQTVEVTIGSVGSLEDAATTGSIPVTLSAESSADQSLWPDLGLTFVAVSAEESATVEFYARRLDGQVPAASGGGSPVTLTYPGEEGPTYYKPDSVEFTAAPGTALEYLMVFNAGSADRENVVLQGTSSPFLEYEPGTTKVNNTFMPDDYTMGECSVSEGCVVITSVLKNEQAYVVFRMTLSGGADEALACNSTNDCADGEQCVLTAGVGSCVATSPGATESNGESQAETGPTPWNPGNMPAEDFACWDESYAQTHDDGWIVGTIDSAVSENSGNCRMIAQGARVFIGELAVKCRCAVNTN